MFVCKTAVERLTAMIGRTTHETTETAATMTPVEKAPTEATVQRSFLVTVSQLGQTHDTVNVSVAEIVVPSDTVLTEDVPLEHVIDVEMTQVGHVPVGDPKCLGDSVPVYKTEVTSIFGDPAKREDVVALYGDVFSTPPTEQLPPTLYLNPNEAFCAAMQHVGQAVGEAVLDYYEMDGMARVGFTPPQV